jgi:hypothetical protein
MRRWLAVSLFCGALGCDATSARVAIALDAGPMPATLRISVYDRFGPLLVDVARPSPTLPTAFTALLPATSQTVRFVVDGDQVLGGAAVDARAHGTVDAAIALAPAASDAAHADRDGDGVPDAVDNCANVANHDQKSTSGGEGDACVGADPSAPAIWRPFNGGSPWNTPIAANATVDPASDALIADFATSYPAAPVLYINTARFSVPVFEATAMTPLVTVQLAPGGVGGQDFENGASVVPIPDDAVSSMGGDLQLCIVDRVARREWGLYGAVKSGDMWTCQVGATADLNGSGVRPPIDGTQPSWQSLGAKNCGYPLIAGLITVDELRSGRIEHALVLDYAHARSRYFTPPASMAQATVAGLSPTMGIPCGGRMQLDPTLDVSAMGLSPSGQTIARALQEYGAYVGGESGGMILTADDSPAAQAAWATGLLDSLEVSKIPLTRFRVLTIGALHDNGN